MPNSSRQNRCVPRAEYSLFENLYRNDVAWKTRYWTHGSFPHGSKCTEEPPEDKDQSTTTFHKERSTRWVSKAPPCFQFAFSYHSMNFVFHSLKAKSVRGCPCCGGRRTDRGNPSSCPPSIHSTQMQSQRDERGAQSKTDRSVIHAACQQLMCQW